MIIILSLLKWKTEAAAIARCTLPVYKHVLQVCVSPTWGFKFPGAQAMKSCIILKLRQSTQKLCGSPAESAHGLSKARAHDGHINVFASEVQGAVSGIDLIGLTTMYSRPSY